MGVSPSICYDFAKRLSNSVSPEDIEFVRIVMRPGSLHVGLACFCAGSKSSEQNKMLISKRKLAVRLLVVCLQGKAQSQIWLGH